MLNKFYTCDYILNGQLVGSGTCFIRIWVNPLVAYSLLGGAGKEDEVEGVVTINFRRVK